MGSDPIFPIFLFFGVRPYFCYFFYFLPKKTDFTKVDYKTIKMIQNRLNNRPRKALDFKTPKEALLEEVA
jgi:hypothetical protein